MDKRENLLHVLEVFEKLKVMLPEKKRKKLKSQYRRTGTKWAGDMPSLKKRVSSPKNQRIVLESPSRLRLHPEKSVVEVEKVVDALLRLDFTPPPLKKRIRSRKRSFRNVSKPSSLIGESRQASRERSSRILQEASESIYKTLQKKKFPLAKLKGKKLARSEIPRFVRGPFVEARRSREGEKGRESESIVPLPCSLGETEEKGKTPLPVKKANKKTTRELKGKRDPTRSQISREVKKLKPKQSEMKVESESEGLFHVFCSMNEAEMNVKNGEMERESTESESVLEISSVVAEATKMKPKQSEMKVESESEGLIHIFCSMNEAEMKEE